MRICFLGTGGSWPTKRRNLVSIAVSSRKTNILLDCGEGTQRQMLFSPFSPHKLDAILISHLHGDHFLGIPGIVQTMSLNDRTEDLDIFGPEGIDGSFEKAMSMCHYHPRFETNVHILKPGDRIRIKDLNVLVGAADHFVPSLAFRVYEDDRPGRFNRKKALDLGIPEGSLWGELQKGSVVELEIEGTKRTFAPNMVLGPPRKGASIAYSGDTAPTRTIEDLARGVDLLIHEATFTSDLSENAGIYKHSTSIQAAEIASRAGVGALYIVHSSPRYAREGAEASMIKEAIEHFERTHMPEDLDCVDVSP